MTNNEYLENYLYSCTEEIAERQKRDMNEIGYVIGEIYADDEIAEAVDAIWHRIEEIVEDA